LDRPKTTTVGSFPTEPGSSPERSIGTYVDLQLRLNFDLIADGEPRGDMIAYFLQDIPGLGLLKGKAAVVGRISEPKDVIECLKVKDLSLLTQHLQMVGLPRPVKIAVTGPVTLGFTCALGGSGPYTGPADMDLYLDLAESIGKIASHLQSQGAIVQVDEPGLSGGFLDPKKGAECLRRLSAELEPERTIVHACGRISPHLHEQLLGLENVGIVSHAFAGNFENVAIIDRAKLAKAGKKLAAGCARVNITQAGQLDSPPRIRSTLTRIQEKVGQDLVAYFHPDCGLRSTRPDLAEAVLRNLSGAAYH